MPVRQTDINRLKGAHFERMLQASAAQSRMLALKNELTFRYLRGGKIRPVRADLDFRVLRPDGRVAYVDCKVRAGDSMLCSGLDRAQVKRAVHYAQWRVPSGFVVFFEGAQVVCFFSGALLMRRALTGRLAPRDGRLLGGPLSFLLHGVFD